VGASARLNQSGAFTTGAKTLDGRMLGPYQLLYEIGRGGMGRVYLAEDTRLGRRVALKMLLRSSTRSPEKVKRFEQEARAASSLNHPNILTIYEIGQIKGVHYLATEYVEGPTLRQMIESRRIHLPKILDIAEQVADALAAAHDANIVHRDIKPENLMLRLDGYVKVLDFGIAKLLEKNTGGPIEIPTTQPFDTQPGAIVGTVDYMSPEQARGLRVDKRTDIFSLGVVLYEMVTGVRPFTGVTPTDVVAALLTRDPIPVTQRLVGAPEALHRVIKRALAKERDERYQSARDLAKDLGLLKQDMELAARVGRTTDQSSGAMPPAPPPRNTGRPAQPGYAPPTQRPVTTSRPPQPSGEQRPSPPTGRRPQVPPQAQRVSARQPMPEPSTARPPAQTLNQSYGQGYGQSYGHVTPPHPATYTTDAPNRYARAPERNKIGFWPWFLLLSALIGLGAGIWANYYRTPEAIGLAVMPFTATRLSGGSAPVTSEDEEALRQALIEGLHESLLQRLAPLPKLQMIARNSVRNLPKDTPIRDIGQYLDASNVLTGRIVTRGSAVTVSVELHDATNGEARWSQRYERTLSDLHTLPEALANDVGTQLPFALNAVQTARLARRETNHAEAFQQYLKGRYLWQQRQAATIKSSLQYLRKATELDPNYARAHAGLAEAYATAPLYGVMPVSEALPLCRAEAAKALQLDAQLAEAYRVQGFVLHQYDWNFAAAEKAFQRALELNGNLAQAHQEYGSLLSSLGRHEDGIAQALSAETLDPLASVTVTNTAAAYYYAGRSQAALDTALRARDIGPNKAGVYKFLGLIYQQMQRPGDAREALIKALTLAPKDTELRAQLVCAEAGNGNHAEALKQLEDLRALPEAQALAQYRLATIYAALGDKERALVALTQAVANKEPGVVWMKVDPQLSSLQPDQRFKELSKQIGLP
jgi:serine/threonine protein kinase/TolB-like protein/lipoprotein NlpI